jgi:hypothetical protein
LLIIIDKLFLRIKKLSIIGVFKKEIQMNGQSEKCCASTSQLYIQITNVVHRLENSEPELEPEPEPRLAQVSSSLNLG